jgi:tetratricopeptide (TPR) repeat protein
LKTLLKDNWQLLVITAFILVLYGRTVGYGFVLDDLITVEENALVKKGISGIPEIFRHSYVFGYTQVEDAAYRPLSLSFFALEHSVFGASPAVFHFFNVLYYFITCVLLWFLLLRIFPDIPKRIILLAVLLFVAHPMHTEVVANIKSRDEILCFLFFISAFLIWLKPHRVLRDNLSIVGLICASALSKETGILLGLALPLYSLVVQKKAVIEILQQSVWVIAPTFLAVGIRLWAGMKFSYEGSAIDIELINNSLVGIEDVLLQWTTKFYLLGLYVWKVWFTWPLSFDYSFNYYEATGLDDLRFWTSALLIFLSLFIAIRNIKARPMIAFGMAFFYLSLFVYSNIGVMIASTFADRFLYIPSLALPLLLLSTHKMFPKLLPSILLALTIAYTGVSFARIPDWKSNDTLILADLDTAPNSAKVHLFASTVYRRRALLNPEADPMQNRQKALSHLHKALEIYPNYSDAYGEATEVLRESKRYADVVKLADSRLKQNPQHKKMLVDKASALFELKRYDEALIIYKKLSLDSSIDQRRVLFNYAAIHFNRRNFKEAIPLFEKYLLIEPDNGYTHLNLGTCWFELENYEKAYYHLSKVPIGDVNYGLARVNMGHTALFMEKLELARDHYLIGLQYFPKDEAVSRNLAIVYLSLGDTATAQSYFNDVQLLEVR